MLHLDYKFKREKEEDNGYWVRSACTASATNEVQPNRLRVTVETKDAKHINTGDFDVKPVGNIVKIGDKIYTDLHKAVEEAKSGEEVKVFGKHELTGQLLINKKISLIGIGNAEIIAKGDFGNVNSKQNLISIETDSAKGTTISNLTIKNSARNGLHVFNVKDVALNNLVIEGSRNGGGLVVNGSTVTAKDIKTSGNAWYGINVDKKGVEGTKLTLSGSNTKLDEPIQIFSEGLDEKVLDWKDSGSIKKYKEVAEEDKNPGKYYDKGYIYSNRADEIFTLGAVVGTNYYKDLHKAVVDVNENGSIDIYGNNVLSKQLLINKNGLTITGKNNATISAIEETDDKKFEGTSNFQKNLVSVSGVKTANLSNLTITKSVRNGLSVFESGHDDGCSNDINCSCTGVKLNNIKLINNPNGSGMVVNGSAVTAANISASGNGWKQSIDVSKGSTSLPSILRIEKVDNLGDLRKITTDIKESIEKDLVKVYIGGKEATPTKVEGIEKKFSWTLN